jgi:hypothetical protein
MVSVWPAISGSPFLTLIFGKAAINKLFLGWTEKLNFLFKSFIRICYEQIQHFISKGNVHHFIHTPQDVLMPVPSLGTNQCIRHAPGR